MGQIEDIIAEVSPYYKSRKGNPSITHNLVYDSPSETLEPIYFWLLNFMSTMRHKPEKIVDNFASSPGSGHFSELGGKKSQMQDQASKILGTINNILRSVLNLIYDLKEFKIRLSHYDAAKSKESSIKSAGLLALKQIWMDKVDVLRGQGSINALSSGNLQFVTLRDAFFAVDTPKDVDKLDLNDRVIRLLKPRILEFNEWTKRSEEELRKRYEIEKTYLKSQVDSLKLQSRWAKPYLVAAEKLSQSENLEKDAALVTAFNTVLLQLTLMGKKEFDVEEAAVTSTRLEGRQLPEKFAKKAKKMKKFYSVIFVDFNFRGIPSKVGQHYVFGGRADIKFKSYGLNEDELKLFSEKMSESDLDIALRLVEGMTDDSLKQLKVDIDELLGGKEEEKKKGSGDNPFSALFSAFKKSTKNKKEDKEKEKEKKKLEKLKEKGVTKDSYPESYARNWVIADAMNTGFTIYDIFKKSMGMASFPYGGDYGEAERNPPVTAPEKFFGLNQ